MTLRTTKNAKTNLSTSIPSPLSTKALTTATFTINKDEVSSLSDTERGLDKIVRVIRESETHHAVSTSPKDFEKVERLHSDHVRLFLKFRSNLQKPLAAKELRETTLRWKLGTMTMLNQSRTLDSPPRSPLTTVNIKDIPSLTFDEYPFKGVKLTSVPGSTDTIRPTRSYVQRFTQFPVQRKVQPVISLFSSLDMRTASR